VVINLLVPNVNDVLGAVLTNLNRKFVATATQYQ
jgi:hypothetical protein